MQPLEQRDLSIAAMRCFREVELGPRRSYYCTAPGNVVVEIATPPNL
jgi:hypothetical protein